MRNTGLLSIGILLLASPTWAEAPQASYQPVGTMSELMVSMVYPGANGILLHINRGGPASEAEWMAVQRSAVLLAESGNVLTMRDRGGEWVQASRALVDVGDAAYRAVADRDVDALAALSERLDASCVSCHQQFRPDVHPPAERARGHSAAR